MNRNVLARIRRFIAEVNYAQSRVSSPRHTPEHF
jgi:hypothetical protein